MTDAAGLITIRSADSPATARIRADVGFNCFSFEAPANGGTIETLWFEPEFAGGAGRPSRSGIPVLFPFAGRIGDARYTWNGREYTVTTAGTSDRHAIHGFVYTRPWRVIRQTADAVTGAFRGSIDAPETLADWPGDYAIELTYRVAGRSLDAEVRISNPGAAPLPFTFGLHPYFRLPLGGSSPGECHVTVPASHYRELESLLPAGRDLPVDSTRDLRTPRRFADLELDDVVTALEPNERGDIVTSVHDPASGLTVTQTFSAAHPFVVVFTPPHREAIAIEPYNGSPDPFAIGELGLDPHLIVLESGDTWESIYRISLEG
jgi:aldose 1-epimerase